MKLFQKIRALRFLSHSNEDPVATVEEQGSRALDAADAASSRLNQGSDDRATKSISRYEAVSRLTPYFLSKMDKLDIEEVIEIFLECDSQEDVDQAASLKGADKFPEETVKFLLSKNQVEESDYSLVGTTLRPLFAAWFIDEYRFVTNDYLSSKLEGVNVVGEFKCGKACSCCGYESLDPDDEEMWICGVCDWSFSDDGSEMELQTGRQLFLEIGASTYSGEDRVDPEGTQKYGRSSVPNISKSPSATSKLELVCLDRNYRFFQKLDPEVRADYFFKGTVRGGFIVGKKNGQWLVPKTPEGVTYIPVWEQVEIGAWIINRNFDGFTHVRISQEVLRKEIIPMLKKQGSLVAVCPDHNGKTCLLQPDDFLRCLDDAQKWKNSFSSL